MKKRLLSLMLALCMMFSSMSMGVSADGGNTDDLTDIGKEAVGGLESPDDAAKDIVDIGGDIAELEAVGDCGDHLQWYIKDGVLGFIGNGRMYDYDNIVGDNPAPWSQYYSEKNKIKRVKIGEGVTYIGTNAFAYAPAWKVYIPSTVTEVGDGAFDVCTELQSIEVDPTNPVLSSDEYGILYGNYGQELIRVPVGRSGISSFTVPYGVKTIRSFAFSDCYFISSVILPDTVTSVGERAFFNCPNLFEVLLSDNLQQIEQATFYNCKNLEEISIPVSVRRINMSAFGGCSKLRTVYLDKQLKVVENFAFNGCKALETVIFSGTQTEWKQLTVGMGNEQLLEANITFLQQDPTFGSGVVGSVLTWELHEDGELVISGSGEITLTEGSDGYPWLAYQNEIRKLTIEEGVTAIGERAFSYCENLTSVSLPKSLQTIGFGAFLDCGEWVNDVSVYYKGSRLDWQKMNVEANNEPILWTKISYDEKEVFAECSYDDNPAWVLYEDGELLIYGSGEMEPKYQGTPYPWYPYRSQITKLTIAEGITSIGMSAFWNCENLTTMALPKSLQTIGYMAFHNCSALKELYFGGRREEWNLVIADEYNEPLYHLTVHYGEPKVLTGDANGDGAIDSSDVNLLYRMVMGYAEVGDSAVLDVNGDGQFNSSDVNLLYRYVMGYAELQ